MGTLERVWAPWRMSYLRRVRTPRSGACIFCLAKRSRDDRAHHVIARGRHVFCLLNRYPYLNGHLMVSSYRHVGALDRLTSAELSELLRLTTRMMALLKRTLRPGGFNVGMNVGRVAGAGIPGHLHLHIVPRWEGDTNFMPMIAHTRVIPQSLDALYHLLTSSTAGRRS